MYSLLRHTSRPASRLCAAARPVPRRTVMTITDAKYTAHATAEGQGRNGRVRSGDDAGLTLRLAMPQSLGGKGEGQNPEQLFAMGYAACFLSALQLVAGTMDQRRQDMARNATVHADVHIGTPRGGAGYALAVDIEVEGVDDQALIDAGHEACPYSRALEHGAVVNVRKAGAGRATEARAREPGEGSEAGKAESEAAPAEGQSAQTGARGYSN